MSYESGLKTTEPVDNSNDSSTPTKGSDGALRLIASALPDGFPPALAFRALAAYSLLRTLSWKLRLSPFTPNVFLRALFLPFPNNLLGQVHACILRILFPSLDLGYAYRDRGGVHVSKKLRVETVTGPRPTMMFLRAGDNLTYLDGLTWPLFFEDYANLTKEKIARASADCGKSFDLRNIGLQSLQSTNAVEESDDDDDEEEEFPEIQSPLHIASSSARQSDTSTIPFRGRGGRGRGLPTRKNRFLAMTSPKSVDENSDDSLYEEGDDAGGRSKRKRKSKFRKVSKKQKIDCQKEDPRISTGEYPLASPGSKVIEVSKALGSRVSVGESPLSSPGSKVIDVRIPGDSIPLQFSRQSTAGHGKLLDRGKAFVGANVVQHNRNFHSFHPSSVPRFHSPRHVSPHSVEATGVGVTTSILARQDLPVPFAFQCSPLLSTQQASHVNYSRTRCCGTGQDQPVQRQLMQQFREHHGKESGTAKPTQKRPFQRSFNVTRGQQPPFNRQLHGNAPQARVHSSVQPNNHFSRKRKCHEIPQQIASLIKGFLSSKIQSTKNATLQNRPSVRRECVTHIHSNRIDQKAAAQAQSDMDAAHTISIDSVSTDAGITERAEKSNLATPGENRIAADGGNSLAPASASPSDSVSSNLKSPAESLAENDFAQRDPKSWPHLTALAKVQKGIPYHRLPIEDKLCILEFLLDELLELDFIAAEFTRRYCVTGCYGVLYGTRPTEMEYNQLENMDECVVCGLEGELLCCDGCPASYHRRCINIMDGTSLPEGIWLCPDCKISDPCTLGPLQGGKKSAVDWFSLKDIGDQDLDRAIAKDSYHRVISRILESNDPSVKRCVGAEIKSTANILKGDSRGEDGAESRHVTTPGTRHSNGFDFRSNNVDSKIKSCHQAVLLTQRSDEDQGLGHTNSGRSTSFPGMGAEDNNEFLTVAGFVFRRTGDAKLEMDIKSHDSRPQDLLSTMRSSALCVPMKQSDLLTFLDSIGQSTCFQWPLSQIPDALSSTRLLPRQQMNYEGYFFKPESYDPSMYISRYRMAPIPLSKKNKCVGSQLSHLVHSEYGNACAKNDTWRISAKLSCDMKCDSRIAKELIASTDVYNPYALFTNYMLQLERKLSNSCLLETRWCVRRKRSNGGVWSGTVFRCKSVPRLARLLVKLIDAANSRAFLDDWHRPPSQNAGKHAAEPEGQSYSPLPPDWTPEAEQRKRFVERSTTAQFRQLSAKLKGSHVELALATNSQTSKGSKRKTFRHPLKVYAISNFAYIHNSCIAGDKDSNDDSRRNSNDTTQEVQGFATAEGQSKGETLNKATSQLGALSADAIRPSKIDIDCLSINSRESISPVENGSRKVKNKSECTPSNAMVETEKPGTSSDTFKSIIRDPSATPESEILKLETQPLGTEAKPFPSTLDNFMQAESTDVLQVVPKMTFKTNDLTKRKSESTALETATALESKIHTKNSAKVIVPHRLGDATVLKYMDARDTPQPLTVHRREMQEGEKINIERKQGSTKGRSKNKQCDGARKLARRSGRLRDQSVGQSSARPTCRDTESATGIEAAISKEVSSKLQVMHELMCGPFVEEMNWPLAGRSLFEPLGSLPAAEMKRLARNAGAVVAPYLTYSASYEVGQPAFCHLWRKRTLQCSSFEGLLMQIRVVESFLNHSTIAACESLARRGSTPKTQGQKVIRCTQRDLGTGTTHYFIVNKRSQRGCWVPEKNVDLSPLVFELAKRRDNQMRKSRDSLPPQDTRTPPSKVVVPKQVMPTLTKANDAVVSETRRPAKLRNDHAAEKVKIVVMEHERKTLKMLLECLGAGVTTFPIAEKNALRVKHLVQLKQVIAAIPIEHCRPDSAQLLKQLIEAESRATTQVKSITLEAKSTDKKRRKNKKNISRQSDYLGRADGQKCASRPTVRNDAITSVGRSRIDPSRGYGQQTPTATSSPPPYLTGLQSTTTQVPYHAPPYNRVTFSHSATPPASGQTNYYTAQGLPVDVKAYQQAPFSGASQPFQMSFQGISNPFISHPGYADPCRSLTSVSSLQQDQQIWYPHTSMVNAGTHQLTSSDGFPQLTGGLSVNATQMMSLQHETRLAPDPSGLFSQTQTHLGLNNAVRSNEARTGRATFGVAQRAQQHSVMNDMDFEPRTLEEMSKDTVFRK